MSGSIIRHAFLWDICILTSNSVCYGRIASYVSPRLLEVRHLADYLSLLLCYPRKTICKGLTDIEVVVMEKLSRIPSKVASDTKGIQFPLPPPWLI
jgi:hypothetical protein